MLVQILLRYYFATERVKKQGLSLECFDWALAEILARFRKGLVNPGEAVGAVAAQSIGEPTTQFALDSFHSSGVTNELVCTGVGRLTELLNDTKRSMTPSMKLPLLEEFRDKGTAERIARELRFVSLGHVAEKLPSVHAEVPEEDRAWSARFWNMYQRVVRKVDLTRSFLRVVLKPEFGNVGFVSRRIEQALGDCVVCAYSPIGVDPVVHIRVIDYPGHGDGYHEFLNEIRVQLLDLVTISGTPEIERVTVSKDCVIDTLGINMEFIAQFREIDFTRVYANDPKEMKAVLGIDAARNCLVEEIKKVIMYDGSYVNSRHIFLLCDVMCLRGFIMPITRHGINRIKTGALRRSTFEETLDVLTDAALNGEVDLLRGVSENVMVGKRIPTGTGCMELRFRD